MAERAGTPWREARPAPFGEYVPARSLLSFYRPLAKVPRDMLPGRAVAPLRVRDVWVGVPISYEVAFGRIVRELAQIHVHRAGSGPGDGPPGRVRRLRRKTSRALAGSSGAEV